MAGAGMTSKPVIVVSAAEPPWLKRLLAEQFQVTVSNVFTEHRGVDVAWQDDAGDWHGVQRKELNDLIASVGDGRLQREVPQMISGVQNPHVIVEGKVSFSNEGVLIRDGWGQQFTLKQWRGLLWSLQGAGVGVTHTKGGVDTAQVIADMYAWSQKERHGTLKQRPGVPRNDWGTRDNGAWSRHFLQGFDGIGAVVAEAIIAKHGLPLKWTVTREDLMAVEGIGKVRADKLIRALAGE